MLTIEQIGQVASRAEERRRLTKGGERKGQALFNALAEMFPEEAEKVRGQNSDCFYQDELIPAFWAALKNVTVWNWCNTRNAWQQQKNR